MRRKEAKRDAAVAARGLLELALVSAGQDMALAKEQAALARRLLLKFNVRFDWSLRRFYCHGCKGLLVPGVNARVRLGPGKMLLLTCSECGHVNRKKMARQA